MYRRNVSMIRLTSLAVLGCLLSAKPATAQNQGYSVWANRFDGGGGGGSGSGRRVYYAPQRPVDSYPAYYSYYSPGEWVPGNAAVSINMTVPPDATVSFDGAATVQTGKHRRFFSPPLSPGNEYVYDIVVRWTQDGREITHNRRISIHAGDVINLTFPETASAPSR